MHSVHNAKFEEMKRFFFDNDTAVKFVDFLMKKAEVYAPHRKGDHSYAYEKVKDAGRVVFNYPRTIQPLKKFFLPPHETLLRFNLKTNEFSQEKVVAEKRIFFGIHSYEMQGLKRLDYSFARGEPESNYLNRRENTVFIGISFTPDVYHFSKSVGISIEETDGFCLYFEPVENGYLVFEVNDEGRDLVDAFGQGAPVDTLMTIDMAEKEFKTKIKYHYNRLPQVFEQVYHSSVWEKVAEKCVGCGTCNLLCPTCYCFDVRDNVALNIEEGSRERFWDGCMLNPFAEVAGNENFREELSSRTRHRLYRKFKYLPDQSGELHCVGCGRCTKYCPAAISITGILNDLIEDISAQQQKQVG
jgi:sulfhydrogenase subunit beta (sulfur reductase)